MGATVLRRKMSFSRCRRDEALSQPQRGGLTPLGSGRGGAAACVSVVLLLVALQPCAAQTAAPDPEPTAAGECVEIETIVVSGVRLLTVDTVRRITSGYEGRCLSLEDLDGVLEELTVRYVDAGYVTTRAYLPEQELSGGELLILVVEGELEGIVMNGAAGEYGGQIVTAFPGLIGRVLNLRDIEQGLEQLNRLRSNRAAIELRAGQELGGTVLEVSTEAGRRWHGSVALDNLGGESTGRQQMRLSVGYDDLLGLNDGWTASYQRSTAQPVWNFADEGARSDTWTGGVSVPIGYWTVEVDGVRNRSWTPVSGQLGVIETSGASTTVAVEVSRVVQRDAESKTRVLGAVRWKENETFVLGSLVEVSSGAAASGELTVAHERQVGGGQGSASVGVKHGPLALRTEWQDRYVVLTGAVSYGRAVALGLVSARYSGTVTWQWSDDELSGAQQQALGGPGSVRGVRAAVGAGNRAVVMRNDVVLQLPGGLLELSGGLDAGGVLTQAEQGIVGGGAIGGTIGVRVGVQWLEMEVSYSELLVVSEGLLDGGEYPAGAITARVSVSF